MNGLLAEFSQVAANCESPSDIYVAMDSLLSRLLEYDRITIRLADFDSGTVTDTFVRGESIENWDQDATHPLAGTATESVMVAGELIIIADCLDSSVLAEFPALRDSAARLPSLVAAPLMYRGKPIGSIQLRSHRKGAFTARQSEAVQLAASHITPTVINAIQLDQLQRDVRERTVLAEIGRTASATIDFGLAWDQFVSTVKSLIPGDRLVMAVLDEDSMSITDRHVYGIPMPGWDEHPRRPLGKVPSTQVMSSRQAVIVPEEENDAMALDLMGYRMSEKTGLRSTMFVPLVAADRIIGTLSVRALQPDAYTPRDLALFERLALQIGGPVAAADLFSRTMRLAELAEKEARTELELENRKLADTNETKSRFISSISHELRTPLTSIIAFTDSIKRDKFRSLSERDKQHLEIIQRNGQYLKALIDDLLDFSSIEASNLHVILAGFELKEAVTEVAASMEPILNAKDQRLVATYSEPDMRLVSDRDRVKLILSNLVSNASKYSGEYMEIKVEASAVEDGVQVSVTDSGAGIDANEMPLLFDEFSRLYNRAKQPGHPNGDSGLGLAISRKLARALGGDIAVSSVKGEGSVFTLTLPLEHSLAA